MIPTDDKWSEGTRVVLNCSVSEATAEAVAMDIVEYLQKMPIKLSGSVWGHFRSRHWPAVFFTPHLIMDLKGISKPDQSLANRHAPSTVLFTIDCRSSGHARSLVNGLWLFLSEYHNGSIGNFNLSAVMHPIERQEWITLGPI